MGLCLLFSWLFCLLACHREGVWTNYTPQDIARWQKQVAAADTEPVALRPTPNSHAPAGPQAPSTPMATRRKAAQVQEVEQAA